MQGFLVERIGDMTQRSGRADASAVGGDDAGALLTSMLERVQPEVSQVGGLGIPEDTKDTAFVLELIQHGAKCGLAESRHSCGVNRRAVGEYGYFTLLCL